MVFQTAAFCGSFEVKVAPREEAETLVAAIFVIILPIKGEFYESNELNLVEI
jgi:hypothetical protein